LRKLDAALILLLESLATNIGKHTRATSSYGGFLTCVRAGALVADCPLGYV
jgi:hypothetical protein